MKRFFRIAVALAMFAEPCAGAGTTRMNDSSYVEGHRCLGFTEVAELHANPANFTALTAALIVGYRDNETWMDGLDAAYRARMWSRRQIAKDNLQRVRDEYRDACAPFVREGLVQWDPTAAASAP